MTIDPVRAWKDADYRASLTIEQQALVPANPAGAIELTEDELSGVAGAALPPWLVSLFCCLTLNCL